MEAKGLCPGAITFFAVLCAYAERGDMGAILDVREGQKGVWPCSRALVEGRATQEPGNEAKRGIVPLDLIT